MIKYLTDWLWSICFFSECVKCYQLVSLSISGMDLYVNALKPNELYKILIRQDQIKVSGQNCYHVVSGTVRQGASLNVPSLMESAT